MGQRKRPASWPGASGVQPQIRRISQIFYVTCHAICDLPFFCLQTKIPEIGVIGGYVLIRVCRYTLGGYPAPYWALGPGIQPQITRISQISHGTARGMLIIFRRTNISSMM